MSNIDKRALRKKLNRRLNDAFGFQRTSGGKHTTISLSTDECKSVLVALDELEAKNKRIAELERNEIREEGNQFLVVRHPGKLPVVKYCAGDLEGFLRQLLEHDPMATIDIITHRYYGVGGQWVQDADEYLQMMAAAAGKGE
ncbi:ead/Ea22-like family protein [Enterobacter hormaechei]|uniref:ead/Ea22-like family protein n=1 Tax=Enterobacter hormaechei TaxID=158836 RepID=UPI0025822164|nr:ead/Ea22-like family protein [Enterobacter hormaechei]